MRQSILNIAFIVISVLLIAAILLQQRGSSLGAAFGGESTVFRTKRGLEKILFHVTVALAGLFFGIAILQLFVK